MLWIVASDQPFTEVENPEFVELLNYVHRNSSGSELQILGHNSIKRRVMDMGENGIEEVKEMFMVRCILLN